MQEWIASLRPEWRMGLVVLGVLVLASIAVWALRRARSGKDFSELRSRVRAWWVMAGVFFAAIALSPMLSVAFFGLMSFWALKEFITLMRTRPADHGALALAFLAVAVQYVLVGMHWYGMFIIFIPVYMSLLVPIRLVLARETSGFVAAAAQIQWGLMAFVFGLSHMAYTLTSSTWVAAGLNGRASLLFLVFVTEMSDVLQYVWGKTLGRHKIIPSVSPNKTWEGFLGGIGSTVVLSLAIRFLTPFGLGETLLVAAIVAVAGFFGGAVMSAIKRDFGVKDFGSLIPGHGGMLDRVDSLCFAAPVFFHYVNYFHA